jgi:hypothetical protein
LITIVVMRANQPEPSTAPVSLPSESQGIDTQVATRPSSMDEVLQIAEDTLLHMRQNLNDYTATLTKQETIDGALTVPHELFLKMQCPHRGGKMDESEPTRIYIRFEKPAVVAGREVIWAKDLHDGKLVVHEVGLMGLLTVRLDPTGMIAMRGQRFPIYEIGMTKLAQKLIERGEVDRNNPDVTVEISSGMTLDSYPCDLIVVRRKQPTASPEDFSRAEIVIDTERRLPLRYTAYGWGDDETVAPLIESYTYTNIKTNLGLTEADFDPKNPEYQYP